MNMKIFCLWSSHYVLLGILCILEYTTGKLHNLVLDS